MDGGASASDLLMQMQADLLDVPVQRPAQLESTARGVAFMAGLATGVWRGAEELDRLHQIEHVHESRMDSADRQRARARWRAAIERSKDWDTEEANP